MLRCHPYCLSRKFTSVFVVAFCIHTYVKSKNALQELYEAISIHMTKQLDGILVVAGEFSQTDVGT